MLNKVLIKVGRSMNFSRLYRHIVQDMLTHWQPVELVKDWLGIRMMRLNIFTHSHRTHKSFKRNIQLEIAAQGIAQCKVSASRVVVDAGLRRIG